ncbi:hypothetical protein L6164_007754 [Bauhinia variegata]|uniref:Uncharacterized protein n=1 Tax=Bauhinia variegata TaxID=167791 RepID=A0ACB9PHE0_BAUVA|nr:hypothetical protein L6164_007754 [Bauhinia variegata]
MACEIFSENCGVNMSPRISFSHDFSQSDVIPVEQHSFRSNSSGLNSSVDFDFCVRESFEQESSSADELFSDGRILPIEIKKKNAPLKEKDQTITPQPPLPPPQAVRENASTNKNTKKESTKESKLVDDEADDKQSSKSFWRFKRSSSCGSGYGRSLCPLPLLSRSNSTGSTPSVKRMPISKEGPNIKQNSQKHGSSRSSNTLSTNSYQKPPLKKSHRSYGNGVQVPQVNPILNVPPANLLGLGSIFSNNRDKTKKK